MTPESLQSLVLAYIERYKTQFTWGADGVLKENDVNFWAWEEFDRLTRSEPEEAWSAILAVIAATDDEYTLGMLAAGPFEDLIDAHGQAFVTRIEQKAIEDSRFRSVLQGVWRSSTPEVWERIERAMADPDDA
jgi:hypothetical protein